MVRRLVAAVMIVVAVSGCSLLTVERLEFGYRREELPRCSATGLPVLADAFMTAGSAAIMGLNLSEIQWVEPEPRDHVLRRNAIIAGVQAAIFAASGAYGIWQRRRCNNARDTHSEWVIERSAPVMVPVGPPGGAHDRSEAR